MAQWNPKKMSNLHLQIMDYVLVNPTATHADIAKAFDVSKVYVGMLTRSDLFQATFKERHGNLVAEVQADIKEKLTRVADVALDRLARKVEIIDDPELLVSITKLSLESLGYGGKGAAVQIVNNNLTVNREVLDRARERIHRMGHVLPEAGVRGTEQAEEAVFSEGPEVRRIGNSEVDGRLGSLGSSASVGEVLSPSREVLPVRLADLLPEE